jgi:Type-A lantibiotic
MSQHSKEQEPVNRIAINEAGEVVIKDTELSEAVAELNDEELDAIAGGRGGFNGVSCTTTNSSQCSCPK